ncbi:LytR/AlgR family response regulator transcription factor [Chitinophaga niabensis]|uniref:Two component transcriptional regulator, LytTR family n=1 Tax=Chitinophaga niabensis TaxID=536979 RepID=A0A1N6JSC1_9BACT|nr:LytTR family DNA-binding domain-containing protein [Chitinophaga niabensis]SIO47200.1 two component transcriptional regulator, LytTR family [Chitinophaga niabensis]
MHAVIIDDEKHCRDVLQMLLERHCPDVTIDALCGDPEEALKVIERLQPQLVFLDVEMPGMNGFELLESCARRSFSVIFTTAYDQYAIKAIRHSALDFLLKPIDKDELVQSVQKALTQTTNSATKVDALLQFLHQHVQPNERLALPTEDGLRMIPIKDITYCESAGGYTKVFMAQQGIPTLICRSLKEVEEALREKGFFRVHNSYLINLSYMHKYIKGDGGEIIMTDGKNIPVSRNRKQDFLTRIERL